VGEKATHSRPSEDQLHGDEVPASNGSFGPVLTGSNDPEWIFAND